MLFIFGKLSEDRIDVLECLVCLVSHLGACQGTAAEEVSTRLAAVPVNTTFPDTKISSTTFGFTFSALVIASISPVSHPPCSEGGSKEVEEGGHLIAIESKRHMFPKNVFEVRFLR